MNWQGEFTITKLHMGIASIEMSYSFYDVDLINSEKLIEDIEKIYDQPFKIEYNPMKKIAKFSFKVESENINHFMRFKNLIVNIDRKAVI
ncbi:hypothetical protein AWH56_008455 [Anaerobacillus isosaccharinicus]|uniref:Uncharacterized protein n=2 Tax=Anaerobacillus isosaccharinicus TaxID=1532552 RepID=A0A7S7RD32_9BACI|nr:hypothetical protein [Anaerobacillus isosaccharinicus]MBA5583985.1 hypothetical protein [Anaerobacillus isosaccharinicus]QOY37597.1 hypothetical protein AWH56_008455 [Anaerobacillus isosaccharinicus]